MKNTLKKGKFRILVYKDKKENIFLATILEFNLTLSSDNKEVLLLEIQQAAKDYIESANELKAVDLLNQKVDDELDSIWRNMILATVSNKIKSPYTPVSALTVRI